MERDRGCWRAGKPSTGKGGKSLKFLLNDGFPLAVSSYQNTAMLPHHQHTSYLSKRRRFCLWSNKFHVDQNCSTWLAILHHMTKLFVMSSNDELLHIWKWCNLSLLHITKLLHMTNLRYVLSFRDLRCFNAISVLLRYSHFCVKHR